MLYECVDCIENFIYTNLHPFDHPFIPDNVTPLIKYFWPKTKIIKEGIIPITAAAIRRLQFVLYIP